MSPVTRRAVLLGGLAGTLPAWAMTRSTAAAPALRDPFQMGVASGDPLPDSVVLWTRLAPAPLNPDGYGGMPDAAYPVDWEIAADESFASVIQRGTATTARAQGHSVHVAPTGLPQGREYFYRFKAAGHISPVGRTRTAPAAGASVSRLRYCFASCQNWEEGWYHAHRGIVADDPDLVLFLGDYMYEKPSGRPASGKVRGVAFTEETTTLARYRARYGQYRTDADLQAAHAAAPWIVVFDDHEVDNNWNSSDSPATSARKAAGFQAFYENMPIRPRPSGSSIQLYRRFQWGDLARFHMLDTRQYRSVQVTGSACGPYQDTRRTLTGAAQEQWLLDGFATHPTTWDFLGQQVFFAQRDNDGSRTTCHSPDSWSGYEASRDRITRGWVDRAVPNPVVLTGDVHRHWAADLRQDYWDHSDPIVGSELVTTSVTSHSGSAQPDSTWFARNPHVKYCRNQRGYVRVTTTPQQLTADFRVASTVLQRETTISTHASYAIEAGRRGLQRA